MTSKNKSMIYFSKDVNKQEARMLSVVVSFSIEEELGNYLGVPLLHNRVNKATYEALVDRVLKRL